MKKVLCIISVVSILGISAQAQVVSDLGSGSDCGTWVENAINYKEWFAVDTLSKNQAKDTLRQWVYDKIRVVGGNMTYATYSPCGNGDDVKFTQIRVCKLTGIVQKRYIIQSFTYIPKPKSEYELTIDSLINRNKKNK
jgi:hypothetical protein